LDSELRSWLGRSSEFVFRGGGIDGKLTRVAELADRLGPSPTALWVKRRSLHELTQESGSHCVSSAGAASCGIYGAGFDFVVALSISGHATPDKKALASGRPLHRQGYTRISARTFAVLGLWKMSARRHFEQKANKNDSSNTLSRVSRFGICWHSNPMNKFIPSSKDADWLPRSLGCVAGRSQPLRSG
jgi:hypothetical protein